jgi:menaquinone-dependent protoporphyrinogen IX oxidase
MKGLIIYKGKYGATRQYAQWIGRALHLPVLASDEADKERLLQANYLVIGSSVYIGKLLIRHWLKKHLPLIVNKQLFFFIVSATPADERAKLEGYIRASVPEEIRNRSKFYFLTGRLEVDKLSWTDRLMAEIGFMIERRKGKDVRLADYDGVKKDNITALTTDIQQIKHDPDYHHEPRR